MTIMVDYNLINTKCILLIPFLVERMKFGLHQLLCVCNEADVCLKSEDCIRWVVLLLVEIDHACWFDDFSLFFTM